MKVGSKVFILSGTHKKLEGKIVAISDIQQSALNKQKMVMGEQPDEEIEPNTYVGVELDIS